MYTGDTAGRAGIGKTGGRGGRAGNTSTRSRLRSAITAVTAVSTVLIALCVPLRAAAGVPAHERAHLISHTTGVNEFNATGMNINNAFSTYTQGSPHIKIAYIEGGINWHLSDAASLASVVYVNWHETPVPCTGTTLATATMVIGGVTRACSTYYSTNRADYNVDGSGVINAAQWAHDPRVHDVNGNGVIDPEDLISAFCGPTYHPPLDASGLPCAISGWDFYHNQNDPATVDSAYQHANNQMDTIHAICPKCTIIPIKAGNEALDPTDNLAKAWQFAADEGANVIVSVTADLGYSPFMRQVIDELHSMGVVMVEASNDFDSSDHQGGMFWPYVIPGNGAVASANGTQWVRSDETSWGPHAMFTVATGGGSTSESTPTTGAVVGLLLSYGELAYSQGKIPAPLSGPEAVQILRSTATPFTDTSLGWPGSTPTPGAPDDWNQQYGYGMPNVYAAMQQVAADHIPCEASITSPDWYSQFDPTTTSSVAVTGSIDAPTPSTSFSWNLEAATGVQPSNSSFVTIGTGSQVGSFNGTLGTLNLSTIPKSFWDETLNPMKVSSDPSLSSATQYTVTFRLVVTESSGSISEDRRAISVVHDPTLLPGFPRAVDPGSAGPGSAGPSRTNARASVESSPQLVDLQGSGHLDMVFGDSAGLVHAIDPVTGKELPGWPVQVQSVPNVVPHPGINPGGQSILANVAVGDLFHTGHLDVVVVTTYGTVDVYNAYGQLLPGWPQRMNLGVKPPPIPRPEEPNVRNPVNESVAAPVLVSLQGGHTLDIVAAGGDGYIHAWQPDGIPVPGWPVKVSMPAGFKPKSGYLLEADHRLEATPTVAWLNGHNNPPDIVERSQFTEIKGAGIQPLPYSFVFAYGANGSLLPGWPSTVTGFAEFYGSAMEDITEGSSSPVAADVNGSGKDVVADSPVWTTPLELNGAGAQIGWLGDPYAAVTSLLATVNDTTQQCQSSPPPNVPVGFTSSGAFGIVGGKLVYAQSGVGTASLGCLQHPNAELPVNYFEMALPANAANNGATNEIPGFPATRQGNGFLTSPIITDVTGNQQASIIEGGDSSAINAVSSNGTESPGFPKFTSGWDLWAPAAGDLLSNGHVDIVATTREGYLYAWATPGKATANNQWWSARHDEYNSGNYGVHSRPPGALRSPSWSYPTATAKFIAPGNTWYDGEVSKYVATLYPSLQKMTVAPSGPAGSVQEITGPPGTLGMSVTAYDASGNISPPSHFGSLRTNPDTTEYSLAAADGGVFSFGGAGYFGSMANRPLNQPVVGIAATPDGGGYWEVAKDGGVFSFGDANFYGSLGARPVNSAIVGITPTPDGHGYWLVASDGGVFAFGDAVFYGSMGGKPLNKPIVGITSTPDGGGYWLVASDGGVFGFGDANFYGSMGGQPLNKPIVGITSTPDGGGYSLVASDGGVFSFGDANFYGSMGGKPLNKPIVGITSTGDGRGYWLVASDGGVFSFGDAKSNGSAASLPLVAPVVGSTT